MRYFTFIILIVFSCTSKAEASGEDSLQAWEAAQATHNSYVIDAVRRQLLKDHPEYHNWLEPIANQAPPNRADVAVANAPEPEKPVSKKQVLPTNKGEVQFGMENDTGNTKNTSINGKANITHENADWLYLGQVSAAYGQSSGKENTANYRALAQANYKFEPDTRWMNTFFWNSNRFTGFSDRFEEVTGISNDWMLTEKMKLTTEVAAGLQQINLVDGAGSDEAILWTRANINWPFTKNWTFAEDLRNSWGGKYDFLWSSTSLTTPIDDHWKMRLSYEADYVNNPPLNRESLDTISLVSLVYGF